MRLLLGLAGVIALVLGGYLRRTRGAGSFRARFREEAAAGLARVRGAAPAVSEADLAALPEPVRRYLRAVGAVGQPRVRAYRVRFRGRIRGAPGARWMPFVADQQSFTEPPVRLFWMRARLLGMPVEAFHRLAGGAASMRVRALGTLDLVDASGPELDRSEAVTLLNDMAVLAPASLLDPAIRWEPVGDCAALARFTHGGHTVAATLHFGADGLLRNFTSHDRSRASPDGKAFTRLPFSTPLAGHRPFGPLRLASFGEARWTLPEGDFTYGEFEILDVEVR